MYKLHVKSYNKQDSVIIVIQSWTKRIDIHNWIKLFDDLTHTCKQGSKYWKEVALCVKTSRGGYSAFFKQPWDEQRSVASIHCQSVSMVMGKQWHMNEFLSCLYTGYI